jgi:ABC-type multidrug transport system ATPase subunit
MIINKGRLIEQRQIDALKDELRQYVLCYRGAVSLVDLALDWSEIGDGRYRATFLNKDNLIAAMERVHRSGCQVVDVVAQEGSLEDYFVETIRRAA